MLKSGSLFTDICIGDIFNRHDFMKHWVKVMFYYYYLWVKIEPNRRYDWMPAKRSKGAESVLVERRQAPFTIYSCTIRIMCYLKVWKYIIAIKHKQKNEDTTILAIAKAYAITYALAFNQIFSVSAEFDTKYELTSLNMNWHRTVMAVDLNKVKMYS